MTERNIDKLREHLFKQLEALNDTSKPADIPRAKAVSEVSQTVINSLKVEVDFHAIMRGAIDLPFIETQTPLLPADTPPEQKAPTAVERTARMLTGNADHPWRKLGRPSPSAGPT